MDATRMTKVMPLASTLPGCMIFSRELRTNSAPIRMIIMETRKPATYSIRPWPKGCSLSGFLPANWNPTKVIREEPASDRLLKASAMIATEPDSIPARNLPANNSTLRQIPTMLQRMP